MRRHIVREGEHMALIAANHGFRSYRTVWEGRIATSGRAPG